jgi:hypothetical protein
VSADEQHVALPKLYGAPAYARPPVAVEQSHRPFDPDELPLEAHQTEVEVRFAAHLPARVYTSADDRGDLEEPIEDGSSGGLRPRLFNLRAIAGRLLGATDTDRATPRDVASRGEPTGE